MSDFNPPPFDVGPPPRPPEPPKSSLLIWLSKPWVIFVLTLGIILGIGLLTINNVMTALLHSREEVVVPNLDGKGLVEALGIVSEMNLSLKKEGEEFDDQLPAGTVLRQQPPSGMKIRTERAIRIIISKGGQAVFVPSVVGRALVEAQSVLASEGLQMGSIEEVYTVEFDKGIVVAQFPSSTTIVGRGALIDVEVSKGLPPAGVPLIPDFVGQSPDSVRAWARDVGVKIKISEDDQAVGVSGTVVRQVPSAGQPIEPRDKVLITIVPVEAAKKGKRLSYVIPTAIQNAAVRIVARNNQGEATVYEGAHQGGQTVEIPINVGSTTRVRIYVNDVLKDERVIEP